MWDNVRADLTRVAGYEPHSADFFLRLLLALIAEYPFRYVIHYRITHYLLEHRWICGGKPGFIFIRWLMRVIFRLNQENTVPATCKVGPGLLIRHIDGVFIYPTVTIGSMCEIYQQVTLGLRGVEGNLSTPIIGNWVVLGAGCKVLGGIRIGDNVKVGANAVVLTDIPSNCISVGVPAKALKNHIRARYNH